MTLIVLVSEGFLVFLNYVITYFFIALLFLAGIYGICKIIYFFVGHKKMVADQMKTKTRKERKAERANGQNFGSLLKKFVPHKKPKAKDDSTGGSSDSNE